MILLPDLGMLVLLLLLLSYFSRVRLCETPQMAAHQTPLSLGFSRREHGSGLPFPSPMHENEKWKWSRSAVSDSETPWTVAYQASPSMRFSRQVYWSGVPLPSSAGQNLNQNTIPIRALVEKGSLGRHLWLYLRPTGVTQCGELRRWFHSESDWSQIEWNPGSTLRELSDLQQVS